MFIIINLELGSEWKERMFCKPKAPVSVLITHEVVSMVVYISNVITLAITVVKEHYLV